MHVKELRQLPVFVPAELNLSEAAESNRESNRK